jgi:hypothetical protein
MRVKNPQNDWATPSALIEELDQTWHFSRASDGQIFDPCPLHSLYDGLQISWPKTTFCNPPYDLTGKTAFVKKARQEQLKGNTTVLLLPVSTSTKLFHEVILPHAQITFLPYRPAYEGLNSQGQWVNPFSAYIRPSVRKYMELTENSKRKRVQCRGAHDAMIVVFEPGRVCERF